MKPCEAELPKMIAWSNVRVRDMPEGDDEVGPLGEREAGFGKEMCLTSKGKIQRGRDEVGVRAEET